MAFVGCNIAVATNPIAVRFSNRELALLCAQASASESQHCSSWG